MDRKLTLAMSGNDTKLHKLFYNLYGFHRLQLSIDACVGKFDCQEFVTWKSTDFYPRYSSQTNKCLDCGFLNVHCSPWCLG